MFEKPKTKKRPDEKRDRLETCLLKKWCEEKEEGGKNEIELYPRDNRSIVGSLAF